GDRPTGPPATPPSAPARPPIAAGQPTPAVLGPPSPAAIVIDSPAPRLFGHPAPAVLAGVDPPAVGVWSPGRGRQARAPDAAIIGVFNPISIRRERLIEIRDRYRCLRSPRYVVADGKAASEKSDGDPTRSEDSATKE